MHFLALEFREYADSKSSAFERPSLTHISIDEFVVNLAEHANPEPSSRKRVLGGGARRPAHGSPRQRAPTPSGPIRGPSVLAADCSPARLSRSGQRLCLERERRCGPVRDRRHRTIGWRAGGRPNGLQEADVERGYDGETLIPTTHSSPLLPSPHSCTCF